MPKASPAVKAVRHPCHSRAAAQAILPAYNMIGEESARLLRVAVRERTTCPETAARALKATDVLISFFWQLFHYATPGLPAVLEPERSKIKAKAARELISEGLDAKTITVALEKAFHQPRARPQTSRHFAAEALGLKMLKPRLTWAKIAARLKPPDYPQYMPGDRLRRDVERLRKLQRDIERFCQETSTGIR